VSFTEQHVGTSVVLAGGNERLATYPVVHGIVLSVPLVVREMISCLLKILPSHRELPVDFLFDKL